MTAAAAAAGRRDGPASAGCCAAIMRAVDVILAFPQLVFALLLVTIIGPLSHDLSLCESRFHL
jgi:ABC-type dipeptide/oligopeptide/nickel transport system permease subunit